MDKDIKHLIAGGIPHLSIWVLAIVTLLFFKIPCCCQCKCDCKGGQLRVRRVDAHAVGTNVVICAGKILTNTWCESVCVSITNRVDVP